MAVAELFVGAFVTVLLEKLASGSVDLIKLARSAGIHSELKKWNNTLIQIQAVLLDAGQKHIEQKSVQLWLNKLQHLAYEIDDVLDDLATEAMRHRLNDASTSNNKSNKVLNFIPKKFYALKYGRKMSNKLAEITTKLGNLVEEKNLLGLIPNVERSHKASKRSVETTSLVGEYKVIGREGDKEALLGKLLGGESSSGQTPNVNVVSIVGLGGIGKTTLAQLLYNDKKVKNHFEQKAWVCVSDEFDVFSISKAIFQAVGGGNQDFANLNLLQVALAEKLSKKRFLLVLDDVWNEKYSDWELLHRPFTEGAPGSKVLVTTRKTMVALVMDSVQTYPLELLSDEEALSLFAQHASGEQNFDVNQILNLHGEDIVKKCGKLPLALRTLGRVFRTKSSYEEWDELLNSEIWNLDEENEILPALRLSYYDLPPHLKQIFAYCCLFPKDYMFGKDELVLLWMAEGFLDQPSKEILMENFGEKCFEELVSRSFFQHSTTNKSRYTMHDLINDMATSVAGEFFLMLDDNMVVHNKLEALEKIHHLSFIRERYEAYKKFKALQHARRLRTFLAMSVNLNNWSRFYISNKNLLELPCQLEFLRVLSLAYYNIEEIPPSIGSLKHMRYLNFSYTKITFLPEQVGDLHNLQSLLLSGCWNLSSLPTSIVKLINLRHLNITKTQSLNKMPSGLDGLTGLQTLSRVIIGKDGVCRLSDLEGLLHLRGQLSIEGLNEVKDAVHAKKVNLRQKKGICDLSFEWSREFDDSRNGKTEYEVLDALRPFQKLARLKIMYYMGKQFPSWVGDPSFICLTQLTLRGCRNCTCLPTLGRLPSLQKLFIGSIDGLQRLDSELIFGPSNYGHGVAFPSLEYLEFKDMKSWEEWSTSGGDKAGLFPCLREVSIINCPKLDVVSLELIMSLQILHVEGCFLAVLESMVGVSSSITRLTMKNIKGLTQLHGEVLEHLKAVEDLSISRCDELIYLWESEVEAYEILGSLQKLELSECENLVSLGEKEVNLVIGIEFFREVRIEHCPRLKDYNCPNSIEKLEIRNTHSVISLTYPTMDGLRSNLKDLNTSCCDIAEVNWLLMSSLESLVIYRSNMRLFPEGGLVHLTRLNISYCDNIESIPYNGYGFLPRLCLRELWISGCKNLKSFPHECLQSLTSLETMTIHNCPNLDNSFPCGLWPPNLSWLIIGELKKPISEWGMQNFPTSLVTLELWGGENDPGVVSFAKAEEEDMISGFSSSFLLPSSLKSLKIYDFMELESLSDGLQHLTCLQHLQVYDCQKLKDLPEALLPSLSSLTVSNISSSSSSYSPELRKKCTRKGKYWPIICQIPYLNLLLK